MPSSNHPDRFWRSLTILLLIGITANISLGYLRKVSPPPDAPAIQVRQVMLTANPKLDRILSAVDFDNTTLEHALGDLTHQADLNLVVLWSPINNAEVEKDVPVTVHLKNVSVSTALDTVLSLADPKHHCVWNEHGGVVTVATPDSIDRSQLIVRMYDVKHLRTTHFHPAPTPNLSLQNASQNQSGNQSLQQSTESVEDMQLDEIKKLITDNVSPESWKDNGGDVGSISGFGDLLIITQTEQAQQKIEAFLQLVDSR